METQSFHDKEDSISFYEKRYAGGYMGHWSLFEKKRLFNLIRELNLPSSGKALDFGCGRGIFTQVIKEALPGWEIFACDISKQAIEWAKQNQTGIEFFIAGDEVYKGEKFDFIHSHHVLEHTYDAKVTTHEICAYAADRCTMLHSVPCRHKGSLEYKISTLVKDGIDPQTGKFFFEDFAHQIRPNVEETISFFRPFGFKIQSDYYAAQHYGALKWIAESGLGFVLKISPVFKAVSFDAALKLFRYRLQFLFYWFCFFCATAFTSADRGKYFYLKKSFQIIGFIFFFWLAIPVRTHLLKKSESEWNEKRMEKNGSELFLVISR
ncbi:MAG: class I SAM-dependent methyltransferase [Bacteroidetes bacterium]|nr:MAG: class I SAM-dependent methyltransferase [Bacteroidota bacterium]REK05791.1 MAG: class I SAM-dependent methyltransferase [Bacteroidota bacterium]REK31904.1 MAG: class I SAM-dependent methyltransferase [Bacteroidota bacterium]REK49969.1 MAG: class I SAM-dependent methyltransferase [Bacteroidota bacterium]